MAMTISAARRNRYPGFVQNLVTAPVQVPPDFVGMHFHRWPQVESWGTADPPPTFRYSWVRAQSHAISPTGGMIWSRLHLGQGQYLWQTNPNVDALFAHWEGLGKRMIYDLQSTPDWASSGAVVDPWGVVGGNVAPDNLQHLTDFMTALLTRYKSVIRAVDVWNEPDFGAASGFFIGSAASMVQIAATLRAVIDAVDPTIKLLAPAYDLDEFLTAGGGQYVDACTIHSYGCGIGYSQSNVDLAHYILRQRQIMAKHGLSALPLWETERGFTGSPAQLAGVLAKIGDENDVAVETKRIFMVEAALGMRVCVLYSHGTDLHGYTRSSAALQQAIDWAYETLSGATITAGRVNPDRSVALTVAGAEITV